MSEEAKGDVWFVYDGDCPLCSAAARALRIRKAVGTLYLVNARDDGDHPLMQEIRGKGLNLDDGMVIRFQDTCYHGADALHVMALLGTGQGWFNRLNAWLFRSPSRAALCYPAMRAARNIALKLKNVPKLNNLQDAGETPLHEHYAARPGSGDTVGNVLILGGYGNFGKRIAEGLVRSGVSIIIAGRNETKAQELAKRLLRRYPAAVIDAVAVDAEHGLGERLSALSPSVVVNTCGPFQLKRYDGAEACIAQGIHYIDLADGRAFVTGITALDEAAKAAGVWVISGASTVPGLSSAVVEYYRSEFSSIDTLCFGISPGQKAERGLATTQGILTYVGKPLKPIPGDAKPRYGWQDIYRQPYPVLGARWMANCDIPDLDLLPPRYGIRHIRFSAGMENPLLHWGIWGLGWLVRLGLPLDLPGHAAFLLRASHWFDRFGSSDGGMHMIIRGTGSDGKPHERRWFIVARHGDGPQIPCVPAIILARRLAMGDLPGAGTAPCVGMVSLEEYLTELAPFAVTTHGETA